MKFSAWIINHYACDTFFDNGGRHYCFAKYLKKANYDPVIFCSNSIHGKKGSYFDCDGLFHTEVQTEIGVPYVFIKAKEYEGNGIARIQNMFDFYMNLLKVGKRYAAKHGKPDVIYASSVHPLTLVAGIKLAKRFGVKCICEVRDLWPESFVAYGLLKPNGLITRVLRVLEKWCYVKSDRLIFTMENAYQYIRERKWEKIVPFSKVTYINNGVDIEVFNYNKEHYKTLDVDLDDPGTIKVIYTGSIRQVNNLGLLLDAAKLITDPKIRILIWGAGNELELLQHRVIDEKIDNVFFKENVKKEYIPYIISKADVNLMHNTDTPIMQYGLSLNKMFEYAAAGKPILVDFGKSYNPLLRYEAALATSDNSKEGIAEGITNICALSVETRDRMSASAVKCAENYDYKKTTKKLIEVIESL